MELVAPSHWSCIDFISDLHLQPSDPRTFAVWSTYLQGTSADAIFILGDLFEVWVGDDILSESAGFEAQCTQVLRAASRRADLFIMCGNRDFLMGPALTEACNATLLGDPAVLSFAGQRWLLTHGDAQCLDDLDYMQFRKQVRSAQWQRDFLSKPLAERLALGRAMRAQSEARKQSGHDYVDVNSDAANAQLLSLRSNHMIHGHTHRPARHPMDAGRERLVLSDWDMGAMPPRAEVLRLRRFGASATETFTVERIPPAMTKQQQTEPEN